MSRFDYSQLAQTAVDLITLFGSPAVAVLPGESVLATDKDWRGADCGGTKEVVIEIAITDFSIDEIDGDRIRNTDKQGWTFPPATGEDLELARDVIQGSQRFSIENVLDVIKPADTVLAYRFQLRR